MRGLLLGLVVAVGVGGCNVAPLPAAGDEEDAERIVRDWLNGVTTGTEDSGWSLLHPDLRETAFTNDPTQYESEIGSADWSGLSWELLPGTSWDGVWVVFVGSSGSDIPDEVWQYGIAVPLCEDGTPAGMTLSVAIDHLGASGIAAAAATGSMRRGECP